MQEIEGHSVEQLAQAYVEGQIDRGELLKRALRLGLTVGAAGSLLTAFAAQARAARAARTPASAGASAVRTGGILREGYPRDVTRIDPINAFWWDPAMFPAVHETLVVIDPKIKPAPSLAERWTTSRDGLVWRFRIRRGLKFHSGAACDAAAIVAALEQMRTVGTFTAFWEPVKSVTVERGNVVKVTLHHPYYDFLFVLSGGFAAIPNMKVRKRYKDSYGVKAADGTGPFKLKEFVPGSHCLVTRWNGYPGTKMPFVSNKGKAHLDGIRWVVLLEGATRAEQIQSGTIDALFGPSPQDVERLKRNKDLVVIEHPYPAIYQLGINFKRRDLDFHDRRVRQAISFAIDRKAIVKTVFFSKASPTFGILNSAFPFYARAGEPADPFNPQKANALLEQVGWRKGSDGIRRKAGKRFSFNAIVEIDPLEQLIAQAVQQMLKKVGIEMKFKVYGADYTAKFLAGPAGYFFNNVYPYMFDGEILGMASKYVPPKACCNVTFVQLPKLDAAFAEWQRAATSEGLVKAAEKAQVIANREQPVVNLVTPTGVWVHRKKVHGWLPLPGAALYPYYQDVWIAA